VTKSTEVFNILKKTPVNKQPPYDPLHFLFFPFKFLQWSSLFSFYCLQMCW